MVSHLLEHLHPVLTEYGEHDTVQAVLTTILRDGTGAHHQRQTHHSGQDFTEIIHAALAAAP